MTLALAASMALVGGTAALADPPANSGGSTQGKSGSDPDGNENGGPDKPGGSGGVDKSDQDGNNGCGNDVDREDDNNGNCGGGNHNANARAKRAQRTKGCGGCGTSVNGGAAVKGGTAVTDCATCAAAVSGTGTDVLGTGLYGKGSNAGAPAALAGTRARVSVARAAGAEVLGVTLTRGGPATGVAGVSGVAGGTLPVTGASTVAMVLSGLGSIAVGTALTRRQVGHS